MSSIKPAKLHALVDCDNFYVSCERVFNPKLKNQPVIVLSNNDGCIVSRSAEVKMLKIGMAKPFHKVEDEIKKHNVKVISSNYALYGDMSRRVMETLKLFTPDVDIYSIDEAFLLLDTNDDENYAQRICQTVFKHTGLPVTVGIASTKTLAKIAVEYAKHNPECKHAFDLSRYPDPDKIYSQIEVRDIWGIGSRYAGWLNTLGIHTVAELIKLDDEKMRRRAGVVGLRTLYELRGISCIELRSMTEAKKGIISSRSFGRYVTSLDELKEAVATYASRAGEKLRYDKSVAGEISVFITTNAYSKTPQYKKSATVSIIPSSNTTGELITLAISALERIYKPHYKYIKACVMLNKITPANERQADIFVKCDIESQNKLSKAIDSVNYSYGSRTLFHAVTGTKRNWCMRRNFISPRYTTNWNELPIANAV